MMSQKYMYGIQILWEQISYIFKRIIRAPTVVHHLVRKPWPSKLLGKLRNLHSSRAGRVELSQNYIPTYSI